MKTIHKCFVVTCLLLFSLSAFGDNDRRSKGFLMFNAGTLTVNIVQLQLDDFAPEPFSVIEERSIGTLGRAELKTFSTVVVTENGIPVAPDPAECREGFPIPIVITEDITVLTFHDLSQLVGSVRSVVCIEPVGEKQGILGKGHWTSGTRRFANVTGGEFHISAMGTPQSMNNQFYTTVGLISGQIDRK